MPTETVYGLAADADNDGAVAKIFAAKGRPADHPLIVHVADATAVDHYAVDVPDFATALMAAFWPGPLTLILPRRPGIASAAAGGHATIGLRCPAHPVAQALLMALNTGDHSNHGGQVAIHLEPVMASEARQSMHSEAVDGSVVDDARHHDTRVWGLAAPSANQFGRVSPTTAAHVQGEFGDELLILDGGPCSVGIESSIIDCTRGQPVLLRPGNITPEQVQAACGLKVLQKQELLALVEQAPKASGTLESHYAPQTRVRLMDVPAMQLALAAMGAHAPRVAIWSRQTVAGLHGLAAHRTMPTDATIAAQQLFATLRELDLLQVSEIWVQTPPDTPDWLGVRDRLQRAAF